MHFIQNPAVYEKTVEMKTSRTASVCLYDCLHRLPKHIDQNSTLYLTYKLVKVDLCETADPYISENVQMVQNILKGRQLSALNL